MVAHDNEKHTSHAKFIKNLTSHFRFCNNTLEQYIPTRITGGTEKMLKVKVELVRVFHTSESVPAEMRSFLCDIDNI